MLPGIKPDELETIQDPTQKLEAYQTVYKTMYEAVEFRSNMIIQAESKMLDERKRIYNRELQFLWESEREGY